MVELFADFYRLRYEPIPSQCLQETKHQLPFPSNVESRAVQARVKFGSGIHPAFSAAVEGFQPIPENADGVHGTVGDDTCVNESPER